MATQSANVLKMLQQVASKEVDAATEALAAAMKLASNAESKLNMLQEYKQDYVNKFNIMLKTGVGTEAYLNYQNFLRKLDQAINGQLEIIASTKQQVKNKRELWQECQRKKLSYEVLTKRSDKRTLKSEQKKDQKMMDEFAMRMSRVRVGS